MLRQLRLQLRRRRRLRWRVSRVIVVILALWLRRFVLANLEGCGLCRRTNLAREAKVADFYRELIRDEDIRRLEVTVDDCTGQAKPGQRQAKPRQRRK